MNATGTSPAIVSEIPTEKKTKKSQPKHKPRREVKLTKILPTDRIGFDKQLDILRAYAACSAQGTKSVTLDELAGVMKMAPTTVTMANPFLSSVGFIIRTDSGYMPSPDVLSFLRAYEWNRDTAAFKLAPIVENAWFYTAIKSKLEFEPMEEEAVMSALAESATAGPEYKKGLKTLIEYILAAGLVQRDGSQLRLVRQTATPAAGDASPPRADISKAGTVDAENKNRIVSTAFSKTAEGAVHFNVSVRVEMAEFAGWQPERISAFFSGIAEVLKAKTGIETEVGS